jgi:hypothetical protein
MPLCQFNHVNKIPLAAAIGCWPVATMDLQLVSLSKRLLVQYREQIARLPQWSLTNLSAEVSAYWVEVA